MPVGTVAGDGVEGVGRPQDIGVQGDLVALGAVGIASAVVKLVVMEDEREELLIGVQLPQNVYAGLGMAARSSGVSAPGLGRMESGTPI